MTGWQFGSTPVARWRSRPLLSLGLRVAVFTLPLIAAAGVDLAWSRAFPPPVGLARTLLWLAPIFLVSTAVLVVTRWVARRTLPLAMLLNTSLAFPDAAPSRLGVAGRRPRAGDLERAVNRAYELGETAERADRAEIVLMLALSLSGHDARTRAHSERVRLFAEMLGEEMQMIRDDRDRLRWAAVLHDVGKLTIAPAILNQRGKPDEEEWGIIRQHPEAGARLARSMLPWLGEEFGRAVEHHHENYDGTGYPHGLRGDEISRIGRVLAVVDSFEIMTAARPYQRPMTVGGARKELVRCAGTQFDPEVVRSFGKIPAARLYYASGAQSLIALVPLVKLLPATLGGMFAPIANLATVTVAALLVLTAMEGTGRLNPASLPRPAAPVALTAPGTFQRYLPPFTTSHTVATIPGCALGLIEDNAHLYLSGCTGVINRFSLYGGTEAQAKPRRLVGADSSLLVQRGRYYFAARGTAGGMPGIYTFDPNTLEPGPKLVVLSGALGMAGDPLGDSLFVAASSGLYRVDDLQHRPRVTLLASGTFDGATVSADGGRIYVPSGQTILGYDRSGHQVLKVDVCCHNPDGLVVLPKGTKSRDLDISGNIFVNANDGTILRIDTNHGNKVSVVVSGGQRGDFMTVGIDGCLYAAQATAMVRMEPCFSAPGG
jgi:putative nucleotidyltransferase with HDIG domain